MRVFVAMVSGETNTFSTIPAGRRRLAGRDPRGGAILEACRRIGTGLGGTIETAASALAPSNSARSAVARVRRPIFPLDDL